MERNPPVRNSHTSTADLLVWPSNPPADPSPTRTTTSAPRHGIRTHQPAGGISKVLFGGQTTEEEAESLNSRKPCSGPKLKEMTGSGIFSADGENSVAESGGAASYAPNRIGSKMHQQAIDAMSHISFSAEDSVSPRKGTSVSEVVRQRELGGHDIFAPPPEVPPRPLAARTLIKGSKGFEGPAPRNPAGSDSNFPFCEEILLKTAKKSYSQKTSELSGNCVFKDRDASPGSAEKSRSRAKHKEIGGSDIFSDGKAVSHEYLGGVRKPPGGESSISLV